MKSQGTEQDLALTLTISMRLIPGGDQASLHQWGKGNIIWLAEKWEEDTWSRTSCSIWISTNHQRYILDLLTSIGLLRVLYRSFWACTPLEEVWQIIKQLRRCLCLRSIRQLLTRQILISACNPCLTIFSLFQCMSKILTMMNTSPRHIVLCFKKN